MSLKIWPFDDVHDKTFDWSTFHCYALQWNKCEYEREREKPAHDSSWIHFCILFQFKWLSHKCFCELTATPTHISIKCTTIRTVRYSVYSICMKMMNNNNFPIHCWFIWLPLSTEWKRFHFRSDLNWLSRIEFVQHRHRHCRRHRRRGNVMFTWLELSTRIVHVHFYKYVK